MSEVNRRVFEVLEVVQGLARLEFDVKAEVGAEGDVYDALAAGINMLGEELSAYRDEVEQRADDLIVVNAAFEQQAHFDALTRLPNRHLLRERLATALSHAEQAPSTVAVMAIDLDGFKDVNDTHGHEAGDRLLEEVGRRLAASMRPQDTAGRVGGDEFAVVMQGVGTDTVLATAARLASRLNEPTELDGRRIRISASIGVALAGAGEGVEDLLRHADVALYACKAGRTGAPQLFTAELHEPILHRQALTAALRGALDRHEVELAYQPIVEIGTRTVIGFEALARWRHSEFGDISPAVFIPIAEQIGMMPTLGDWVMRTALSDRRSWSANAGFGTDAHIAVNLSAVQLEDESFPRRLEEMLAEARVPARLLTVEVTESQLVERMAQTVGALEEVRKLGARVAIDDFGTGYSSLSYLRALPVDLVKIDRSFIKGIGSGSEEWAFAQAVVRLVKRLGLGTIAEGIEDATQLAHARALGCDMAQGYYLGRPADAATARRTVEEGSGGRTKVEQPSREARSA